MKPYLPLVLTLLAIFNTGTAIKCFKCRSSNRNSNCAYPTDTNGVEVEECITQDSRCFHYDYNVEGLISYEQFIQRGCLIGTSNFCIDKSPESPILNYQCKICHEEKCNRERTMLNSVNGTGNDEDNNRSENDEGSFITPTFTVFGVTLLMLVDRMY